MKPATNKITQPTKTANTPLPEKEITGVKCHGCDAFKKIVTHANQKKQPFCQRCNMKLIRKCGSDYGQILPDPAATLKELEERKEVTKDRKAVRKIFYNLITMMEDADLADDQRKQVFLAFATVFSGLPEADVFINTNSTKGEK